MAYGVSLATHEELALLVRAGHGLIVLETPEETRALNTIRAAAALVDCSAWAWSCIRGLTSLSLTPPGRQPPESTQELAGCMNTLASLQPPWVVALLDAHRHVESADGCRMIREAAEWAGEQRCSICMIHPPTTLPDELERLATHLPYPLPDAPFLEDLVKRIYRELKKGNDTIDSNLTREGMSRIVEALVGLTALEAERIVRQVILRDHRLDAHDVEEMREAKRRAASSRGKLEILSASEGLDSLGGFIRLKEWLRRRSNAASRQAADFGLRPPRGLLLLGVPGCGKSAAARLIAGEWKRPLARLDAGSLYDRFIGASEQNLRESLRQAEAIAPCVLWMDEIEKAFASFSTGSADGGVSQRLFATLLSWMNDRESDVFLVATANDVSRLPSELMRKGRFDEVFFVDLPSADARRQILIIHLEKRRRKSKDFDLDTLVAESDGFSGAEIEQAVVAGLHRAFDHKRELTTDDILAELAETRPISVVMREAITRLRLWARDRCVSAD